MKLFKKYEFNSQEQAETKIAGLPHITDDVTGESYLEGSHTIVKLGNVVVTPGEYDEEGNETIAPVLADNYSVDVLWYGIDQQPEDWIAHEITLDNNGVHTFLGIDYI